MKIEPLDAAHASDAELQGLHELTTAIQREVEPDDPIIPLDVAIQRYRDVPSWAVHQRWVARQGDVVVGDAFLELEYTESNRHLAFFDVSVAGDHRNQHLATRLLAPLAEAAAADERTVVMTWTPEVGAGDAFAAALGFEKRSVERRSRLLLSELDRAMLDDWVAGAAERAADYSLVGFEERCPDDLLEPFVALWHVMNTAPRDDLDMEDWQLTPERFREQEARAIREGRRRWVVVARHDPSGELAGFTELGWAPWETDLVWQGDTGVDPAHREKGLGRWLKAVNLLRLLDERPEVTRIDTWNAGSNRPMLAINIALGFRPVKHYGDWQISVDALRDAVAKRS